VGLRAIDFLDAGVPTGTDVRETEIPAAWRALLEQYFAGASVDPCELPVDLVGTAFQQRVWGALRRIPRGQVRSYAHIATQIGAPRAMRAVGRANGRNPIPIVVPCHRVIAAGHQLGGYSAGLDRKRALLTLEGVLIRGDRVLPGQLELLE
jgi:O-6-methylguanine DNA methyltransferase